MSEARSSSVPWLIIACGVFFAVCAAAFAALYGGGGMLLGQGSAREPVPAELDLAGAPSVDLSPEGLLGAERVGGSRDPALQTAQAALEKAGGKALELGQKTGSASAHPEITDFDGKGAVKLKPRAVPRGPLAYLTLTTINPSSVTVAEGSDSLGQTPISNVPVLVGKHAFRLLDNRGVPRRLELEFEHGQTVERLKLDVSQLPRWEP